VQRQAFAQATQSYENNRPQIDLFAGLSLNGRAESASEAMSRGWDFDQKTSVIGVRVVSTLDFWNRREARSGALQERESTTLAYDRKRFEYEHEWVDLNSRLKEAQLRLKLSQELALIHAAKLERERDKLKRGRSTTFQVIEFENDSATAELAELRARSEIIRIRAQLATFTGELQSDLFHQ
jgi:outer membrane protein TolC